MQGELAHAAGADAATGSEETQRLRSALERIAAIEDKLYGNDWEEIEEARTIARRALGHSGTAPEGALCVAGAACVLGDPEVLADGVQACVPAGHVLMPVEPDTELLMALARAAELEQSDPEDHRHDDGTDAARTIYKALIVAARTAGLPATGAAQQQRAPVSEETLLAIWNEIDAEDEKVLAFGFAVARNVAATLGALAAAPAADTRRLDWLESDGCTGVFKLGGKWYTRKDYGSPHRKASSLRAAIDAASAVPANFERRPAGSVMMSAHALCPTDMPHPKRMAWMADYFLHHYALGGVEACKP